MRIGENFYAMMIGKESFLLIFVKNKIHIQIGKIMSCIIIHLSDIHISLSSDHILSRAENIAKTTFSYLVDATHIFIVLSGDISQSGEEKEYELALKFIKEIEGKILQEKDVPISYVVSPGNHDCILEENDVVRAAIQKEAYTHSSSVPEKVITFLTDAQKHFDEFRKEIIDQKSIVFADRLWVSQEFSIEGKNIIFDSLNASWMSSYREKPGGVFFPFERYTKFKASDANIRVGVLHHPFNWYNQTNYQSFRKFMYNLEDIIISGHEHDPNFASRDEKNSDECRFIEGAALQSRTSRRSGFNIVTLDLETNKIKGQTFELEGEIYKPDGKLDWQPINPLPEKKQDGLILSQEFMSILTDPGATLHHPDRKDLKLDDFYVFPDLEYHSGKKNPLAKKEKIQNKKNSKSLTKLNDIENDIILEGQENSGKTRLLYQLFLSYYDNGYLPILIDARKIKSGSPQDLKKLLIGTIEIQYAGSDINHWHQSEKKKKVILIDDFDQMPLQNRNKKALYEFLEGEFARRVYAAGENFSMTELFSEEKTGSLAYADHYEILPFGFERRGELVRKWNRLGITDVTSNNSWLTACSQAEKLIEAAKLQHVATTVPIMVLSLLNLSSSGITKEMHNSSFAHYFYFLIVGALDAAEVRRDLISKYLAFCTHLSWYIKNYGVDSEITEDEFKTFCQKYSAEWTSVDPGEMKKVLETSRIIRVQGDQICFSYQYAYYYFLGRYANAFINSDEVKDYLSLCMNNLYVREYANTLLFLAHHSEDSVVLDGVITALSKHFPDVAPADFGANDVKTISELISRAPAMAYVQSDPVDNRIKIDKLRDENDDGHDGLADKRREESDSANFVEEMTSITKILEIAGALITNQFANLSREKKNQSINKVFEGCLRVIEKFYKEIALNSDVIIKEISLRYKTKLDGVNQEQAEELTRQAMAMLLRLFSTSWIERAGMHLTSPELKDNIDEVIGANSTFAMRTIRIAQQLGTAGRLPQGAIKSLIRDAKDNPCVMSVLQLLILRRLYMFETEHDDKDWAISTFELGGQKGKIGLADRQKRIGSK